jgi:hypothetical protein
LFGSRVDEYDKFIQDESKSTQLLVTWRGEYTKGLDVHALLVEHDKEFNWDEDKLKKLYQKYWYLLETWASFIGKNWLLNDATVLTTVDIVRNGGYRWIIFVCDEKVDYYVMRPLWIDAER